jgi:hypothetical protein
MEKAKGREDAEIQAKSKKQKAKSKKQKADPSLRSG